MQIGAEPRFVLFFDCPEEEMVKRVLSRNEVPVNPWRFNFSSLLRTAVLRIFIAGSS